MAKKKKGPKKRNLKYGFVNNEVAKQDMVNTKTASTAKSVKSDNQFKTELRKNILFLAGFFGALFVLYFLITKTSILSPVLGIFGLKNLY